MKRRDFLLISLGAALAVPAWAAENGKSSPISTGAAINKAGRQRMLSQRMAKAFGMQMLGVMPEKAAELLGASQRLFETQLDELRTLQPNEGIHAAFGALEKAWDAYKVVLAAKRTPENARQVLEESEKTLRAAHALTGLYEKHAGSNAGRLVNVAGRQRMLSQRMAKSFIFIQAGVSTDTLRPELDKARGEFVAALDELNAAKENTDAIRNELMLGNTQWMFFDQALKARDSAREVAIRDVATTSERILEVMNTLTGQYEALMRG